MRAGRFEQQQTYLLNSLLELGFKQQPLHQRFGIFSPIGISARKKKNYEAEIAGKLL
jgi:hypothetical protein